MSRWILAFALVARLAVAQDAADAGSPSAASDAGVTVADGAKDLPAAEPISFKSAIEKVEVTIGEPFHMTIEVRHAADEKYALPDGLSMKDFSIRDRAVETHGEGPKTTLFRLTLQAFNVGDVEIPAIHLVAQTAQGAKQLEIPPQKIKVNGVIDLSQGEPSMREDRRPLPTRYHTVWWPIAVLLGTLGALGAAFAWYRRSKNPPPPPPPKPRPPPYEEAMERLMALEREGLVAAQQKQAYFFRLSEIVRDYLGRRYEFDALELTSDELLHELRKRSTWGLDYDRLTTFLGESDLVKFAKLEPSDGECKTAFDLARLFVEQTKPLPAAADAGRPA